MQTLSTVIEQLRTIDAVPLEGDTDLFEAGLLDSMHVISLVGWIEQTFGIEIDPLDVIYENFGTPSAIAGLIDRMVAA